MKTYIPLCSIILLIFLPGYCDWNQYTSSPDIQADSVMVYRNSNLWRYVINNFEGNKIVSKHYSNNGSLQYIFSIIFDNNQYPISIRLYNQNGLISRRDTTYLVSDYYKEVSIHTTTTISLTGDTNYSFDTIYTTYRHYNFMNGMYLPDSVNNIKYSYSLDTINNHKRIYIAGDPEYDTTYFDFDQNNNLTFRYLHERNGFFIITSFNYSGTKLTSSIQIQGQISSLDTLREDYVYKFLNSKIISQKKIIYLADNVAKLKTYDLMGRISNGHIFIYNNQLRIKIHKKE